MGGNQDQSGGGERGAGRQSGVETGNSETSYSLWKKMSHRAGLVNYCHLWDVSVGKEANNYDVTSLLVQSPSQHAVIRGSGLP